MTNKEILAQRISALREEHLLLPENMDIIREYIEAIGEYYSLGLSISRVGGYLFRTKNATIAKTNI